MKFFKPEDFVNIWEYVRSGVPMAPMAIELKVEAEAAKIANAKLEREGKVVFSMSSDRRYWEDPNDPTTQDAIERSDLRALLINIEPIEKCTHPAEKIRHYSGGRTEYAVLEVDYQCECGAKVKPASFKEEV